MDTRIGFIDSLVESGYFSCDDFLTSEEYQALLHLVISLPKHHFRAARVGHSSHAEVNKSIRSDHIFWVDYECPAIELQAYFAKIEALRQALNEYLFLGLQNFEAHLAHYEPGTFYKKHIDQFTGNQDRRISCVYYLNTHWQKEYGGALQLYQPNDALLVSIEPRGNRFVCFNSNMAHEVCTTYAPRYSITGWLKTRPL